MRARFERSSADSTYCVVSRFARTGLHDLPWQKTSGLTVADSWKLSRRPALVAEPASEVASVLSFRRTAKAARLEAALFVADGALSARRLVQVATLADASEVRALVEKLNQSYDHAGSGFRIEEVARGYRMLTRPVYAYWLDRLHRRQNGLKLSPPAMETLAIVAYRQPVTRADVEAIRGVQCTEMLKHLMERGLLRIAGEENSLGRPFLYETTRQFLELFGLGHLEDLPQADRLCRARPEQAQDVACEKVA